MTVNLLKCSNKCKRLYKDFLINGDTAKERFVKYRNMLNRLKVIAKREFYDREITSYKVNCKKIWQLLNDLIKGKNDKSNIVSELIVDGKSVTNPKFICQHLNQHFSTVGTRVTNHITKDYEAHKKYLN